MATKSRPLPRKTVAKNRSSCVADPIADHADEPQEGDPGERHDVDRHHTALRLDGSRSQPKLCAVSAGVDTRINTSANPRSTEKMIPATAAARGVVKTGRVMG